MTDRIELYRTRSLIRRHGGWRWRYVAENGNILADSGQGYSRRIDALRGAEAVTGRTFQPERDELLSSCPPPKMLRVVEVGR